MPQPLCGTIPHCISSATTGAGVAAPEIRKPRLNGVIAMQRRGADVAVAGAGEQRDRGLDPARQPYGDTITRAYAVAGEVRCETFAAVASSA